MKNNKVKTTFLSLMQVAGVTVNGNKPYDIKIFNDEFYPRVMGKAALGLGESYMDNWWDCMALDQFVEKVLRADLLSRLKQDWTTILNVVRARLVNLQTSRRAFLVGKQHYDIGNDLYQRMLDKHMQYTCGYWKNATNLEAAQEAKLEMICRKTGLQPGMTVAELGCGFGGFARYAAEKYGVQVVGFTISKEQAKYAREICRGLPVDIKLEDYRKASGKYDRVISVGLMEHVGYKNYRSYMELTSHLLKDDGIALLHTIGGNHSSRICNPWTTKYIFPNSMIPSIRQLGEAMEGNFVVEDWHNFGEDYDKTLMAWWKNFNTAWPELKSSYSEKFYRMWKYYLLSCAGSFRARDLQLWQIVMTKPGRTQPACRLFH